MNKATAIATSVQALIMAGGQGERLYPLTASRPKPAVQFGGVFRIVDFTLSNCINSGLGRTSLLTQYKHEALQAYIQQSWSRLWNEVTRERLVCLPPGEGNRYRGTADAVFQNISTLRERRPKCVLILSGDQVYRMDYRELLRHHTETHADLTIATVEHPLTAAKHFGVVEVDSAHRVVGFQEKPSTPRSVPSRPDGTLISMGVYAFKTEVLLQVLSESCDKEKGYDFGHHIIPSLLGSAHIRAYDFRDKAKGLPCYWRDIGTLDAYYEASMDLVRPGTPFDLWANADWPSYPARYESSSHFGSLDGCALSGSHSQPLTARLRTNCRVKRSILSPGIRIEDGGLVESSVLMSQVSVGKNTRIRHAIIEEGVHIPAGFEIGFDRENDRKHYFVTDTGVVVVSHTPKHTRPIVVCLPHRMRRSRPDKSSRAA
jgi:glucose-1-phosphate adenylyltransferase